MGIPQPVTNGSQTGRIALQAARALARHGRYDEAESLLEPLLADDHTAVEAGDLLARIKAQQGHLLAAERLWLAALERDPANPACQAGLACLRSPQPDTPALLLLRSSAWALPLVVALVIAAAALGQRLSGLQQSAVRAADQAAAEQRQVQSRLAEVDAALKSLATGVADSDARHRQAAAGTKALLTAQKDELARLRATVAAQQQALHDLRDGLRATRSEVRRLVESSRPPD